MGRSIPRVDIPAKVDGSAAYGIDAKLPGMLYAAVKTAPVFGAKLVSVDHAPAMQKRGVRKVLYPAYEARMLRKMPGELPKHIGVMLDGNRRWAKAAGAKALEVLAEVWLFLDDECDERRRALAVALHTREQYLIGYSPSRPPVSGEGEWRSIQVRVTKPGVSVRDSTPCSTWYSPRYSPLRSIAPMSDASSTTQRMERSRRGLSQMEQTSCSV